MKAAARRQMERPAYPEERLGVGGAFQANGVVSVKAHACDAHPVAGSLLAAMLERIAPCISTYPATTSHLHFRTSRSTPRLTHLHTAPPAPLYTYTRTHARTVSDTPKNSVPVPHPAGASSTMPPRLHRTMRQFWALCASVHARSAGR